MDKVLVIIPAFNEEDNIEDTVERVIEAVPEYDYVVVNDSSGDATLAICRSNGFRVLNLPINLGIGGAVQTGFKYAELKGYDYAVQIDGDGQHDPKYIKTMMEAMKNSDADMVIGSRFIEKEGFQSYAIRRWGIKYFSILIKLLTGRVITDPTSGLRLVGKGIIGKFAAEYPRDYPEPETALSVLKDKYKVAEIPVVMHERQGGRSSISIKAGAYYMIKVTIAIFVEMLR
ncbi:MAG: glycosyltransferase family 2 protein [Lachnospiraceae bacterium]|nr:glycosyltransferase family 2 protein [Lachnospiraceae bacterium]